MFPINDSLIRRSRLPEIARTDSSISAVEIAILFACGFGAAAMSTLLDGFAAGVMRETFGARNGIPGHAILRGVLPISMGLALVPRRGAGVVMGSAAALGVGGMTLIGHGVLGMGEITSLVALGPTLDLAVRKARPGWRLYAAFGAAGFGANLLAFLIRGAAKVAGGGGARPLSSWLAVAPLTYAACGLIAGVVCGFILFRSGDKDSADSAGGTET